MDDLLPTESTQLTNRSPQCKWVQRAHSEATLRDFSALEVAPRGCGRKAAPSMMYHCPSIGRSVAITKLVMKRQGFARVHRSLWWSFVELTAGAGRSIPRTALSRKEEGIGDPRSQELRNAMDSTFQLCRHMFPSLNGAMSRQGMCIHSSACSASFEYG